MRVRHHQHGRKGGQEASLGYTEDPGGTADVPRG